MAEVDLVLPLLRQHVLKIGLSKSQLKETTAKDNTGEKSKLSKLTNIFTHRAVEEAHRVVEGCRERLMQEHLLRRAKVVRRLKREEEEEMERIEQARKEAARKRKEGEKHWNEMKSAEMLNASMM